MIHSPAKVGFRPTHVEDTVPTAGRSLLVRGVPPDFLKMSAGSIFIALVLLAVVTALELEPKRLTLNDVCPFV